MNDQKPSSNDLEVIRALMDRHANEYFSPTKPFVTELYRDLEASIRLENRRRDGAGEPKLKTPSLHTFRARVNELKAQEPWRAAAARDQLVRDVLPMASLDVGEVLRLEHFQLKGPSGLRGVRLHLFVLTEIASGYVVGIKVSTSPIDLETVGGVLWMALTDKSQLALQAGAACSWLGQFRPQTIWVEQGSPLVSEKLQDILKSLDINWSYPPAGLASPPSDWLARELDGFMSERSGTMDKSAILGEAQKHLIRTVCDTYHNAPRSGGGDTPHNAFVRGAAKRALRPMLSDDMLIPVFGTEYFKRIGENGIEFAGMLYDSPSSSAFARAWTTL